VDWFFSFIHRDQRDLSGIDAALVASESGSVGDRVWHDDGDGVQEAGEPGVAGIPVELQAGSGVVEAATLTGPDGTYLFEAVPAGNHTVRFGPLPAGLRFTADDRGSDDADSDADPYSGRARVIVEGGEADLTVDAGVVTAAPGELGHVGDFVWTDLDSDGVQDAGEPGEAGVAVALVGANTGQLSLTFTDADGRYSFLVSRAIAPDQPYRLVFDAPPGRSFSPPDAGDDTVDSDVDPQTGETPEFTLDPDESDTTIDAGIRGVGPPASIGDFVWEDLDGDGIQDAGEPGLATVIVELRDANDALLATDVTGVDGAYRFAGLAAGEYRVGFDGPPGYVFSAADQGADDTVDSDADLATGLTPPVTVRPGDANTAVDAGLRSPPDGGATIGDFAWRDLDRDGVQDPGEAGLANLTVRLQDPQGTVIATTTTDSTGLYQFVDITPGDYRLRFISPTGLLPTVANAGTDDTVDSDVNGGGETPVMTLAANQTDLTIDAGYAPPA
jgi:hypothetical protein